MVDRVERRRSQKREWKRKYDRARGVKPRRSARFAECAQCHELVNLRTRGFYEHNWCYKCIVQIRRERRQDAALKKGFRYLKTCVKCGRRLPISRFWTKTPLWKGAQPPPWWARKRFRRCRTCDDCRSTLARGNDLCQTKE